MIVDPPDNSWGKAKVRIADGVLDVFHGRIEFTLAMWEAGDVVNVAPDGTATASSTEVPQFGPQNVNDDNTSTRWASGYNDDSWVQVKLAEPTVVRGITLTWESACANAYELQTSNDGTDVDDDPHGRRLDLRARPVPLRRERAGAVRANAGHRPQDDVGLLDLELGIYAAELIPPSHGESRVPFRSCRAGGRPFSCW